MLRTSFPLAIHAEHAAFDVQFGHVWRATHRNTSWDQAKDEVAAHKWVDVSQRDYGAALLNTCKYGCRVKDSVIDLALIRSVPYPGPTVTVRETPEGDPDPRYTDQCKHAFAYSLYPHPGDHVDGGVVRAAYELHEPLKVMLIGDGFKPAGDVAEPDTLKRSFLTVEPSGVIVETVKLAEDGDDVIVRLYESEHRSVTAEIQFGFPATAAAIVNLLEEHPEPLPVTSNTVRVPFGPFEIKTLRVAAAESFG
jgi:alpha-mannosidase